MVESDTRNNLIVIIILVAAAVIIVTFIAIFADSLLKLAEHGEATVNKVGKEITGNVSETVKLNRLNLDQFNKSISLLLQSQDRILATLNNISDQLAEPLYVVPIHNTTLTNSSNSTMTTVEILSGNKTNPI